MYNKRTINPTSDKSSQNVRAKTVSEILIKIKELE